jgi:hypothetical protein
MTNSHPWTILDGLPPYGPMAVPFSLSGQGLHREGLVVSFAAPSGTWVGNFQRGDASLDEVLAHPDGQHVVVVAGGNAYVIDPEDQSLHAHLAQQIEHIVIVSELGLVFFGNGLWFEAVGPTGTAWRSRRFSWDGVRQVELVGLTLRGEAYAPEGPVGAWYPFELDIRTGTVSGGSYNGPSM